MEPDMASAMLRNLQTHGYEVNILHGDRDSTTMARIRPEFKDLQKKNDKNHFKKNLSRDFYKLSQTHKELKSAGVIPYLTRCYMYPISSQCASPEDLANKLEVILYPICMETIVIATLQNGAHIINHHQHTG